MSVKVELVARRNKKLIEKLVQDGWMVIDVSNRSVDPTWKKFSPTFAHGDIPVPGRTGVTSVTVEGIWQGLKTFKEGSGIDTSRFNEKNEKGVTRSKRKYGEIAGYMYADQIVNEARARLDVFVPAYQWVLENKLKMEVQTIIDQMKTGKNIALVDHNIGENVNDETNKRFSHAAIIKHLLLVYSAQSLFV